MHWVQQEFESMCQVIGNLKKNEMASLSLKSSTQAAAEQRPRIPRAEAASWGRHAIW
jgi:hypothetical protein